MVAFAAIAQLYDIICDSCSNNRYFKDNEFRRQIDQDVKRTFPEIDFFREARVQEELLNVLFCYSKKYPDLSYRQGMYECKFQLFNSIARNLSGVLNVICFILTTGYSWL